MADTYSCVKVVLETCTWAVICPDTLIWEIIDPFPVRAVWLVLPVAESANHFWANQPTVIICQVTKSKSREEEPAATAAGPSNSVPEEGPADPLRCDLCGLMCKSKGGLSVHKRAKHPEAYHAGGFPKTRLRERWTEEALHLLAREEARLVGTGLRDRLNQQLRVLFPKYTIDQIKGQRVKSQKYQTILAQLLKEQQSPVTAGSVSACRDGVGPGMCVEPSSTTPALYDSLSWAQNLKTAINVEDLACPVDLESIAPGRPTDETRSLIESEFAEWVKSIIVSPVTRSKRPGGMSRNVAGMNASKLRRYQYARIQALYKRNRGRCADEVLSGKWTEVAGTSVQMKDMEPVWRGIMETPSVSDMRTPVSVGPILWQLLAPVTVNELEQTLRNSSKTAPGPDSISWKQLKGISANALVSHFNLWHLASYQPSPMRLWRTVFLEKVRGSLDPLKQRPITIASYVIRTFHKIMANRLESTLPWNVRQKAFMKGDGIAQNVWLLKNTLEEHKNSLTPLCLAFVDVKKALDSVSHETILIAARRMGVPEPMVEYLREFYKDSQTVLEVGGERSAKIKTARGVKQGDPLSAYLFNAVVDMALADLDPHIGVYVGKEKLNALAYADDVVLLASSPEGLQSQLDAFVKSLGRGGLEISAGVNGKSASLRIDVDGKAKRWVVNPHDFLKAGEESVPALSVTQGYKYLGITISASRASCIAKKVLDDGMRELSQAPLKPQQRLYLLRLHLIPKLYHTLVLSNVTDKTLKWLDCCVRSAVRSWLPLPKDTTNAKERDGGLAIPSLRHSVPNMRSNRLGELVSSADPAVVEMLGTKKFQNLLQKLGKFAEVGRSSCGF